jgi:hypothetical protein
VPIVCGIAAINAGDLSDSTTWKERPIMRKLRMTRQAWSYPQDLKTKERPAK